MMQAIQGAFQSPCGSTPPGSLEQRATQMRHAPTSSEARLFEAVRGGRLGVTFRRQVPLGERFIADLYAAEVRLVVEADGLCHARRRDADARRDRAFARLRCTVLRVEAEVVMNDLASAVERVRAEIAASGNVTVGGAPDSAPARRPRSRPTKDTRSSRKVGQNDGRLGLAEPPPPEMQTLRIKPVLGGELAGRRARAAQSGREPRARPPPSSAGGG